MDQMSSRSEHGFASQRTSLESIHVVLERARDTVDYFLRETHTPPVDIGCDRTEIGGGLGFGEGSSGLGLDNDNLWFAK